MPKRSSKRRRARAHAKPVLLVAIELDQDAILTMGGEDLPDEGGIDAEQCDIPPLALQRGDLSVRQRHLDPLGILYAVPESKRPGLDSEARLRVRIGARARYRFYGLITGRS